MKSPGHPGPFRQGEKAVVAARQGHAHMPIRQQRVAHGQSQRQRQRLFMFAARPAGPGIVPAMPGIDHHQRTTGIGRPFDRRQPDCAPAIGQCNPHDIGGHAAAPRDFKPQPCPKHRQRQGKTGHDRTGPKQAHPIAAAPRPPVIACRHIHLATVIFALVASFGRFHPDLPINPSGEPCASPLPTPPEKKRPPTKKPPIRHQRRNCFNCCFAIAMLALHIPENASTGTSRALLRNACLLRA